MKYWLYVLMGLLIASGAIATKASYGEQNWYPGKGLEPGMLVKYNVSTFDYLQSGGQPFSATMWFGSQDDKGNWLTYVIIDENGKITDSNLTLSALTLTPIGLGYKDEFVPYKDAFRNSLGWIGDYTNKDHPKSLTSADAWGIIAAIGGGGIIVKPSGTETLQLAGKSWDTTIIGFHYGTDSKIWISDSFPLPLKAMVFTGSTQKPPPVQFSFELVEFGKSDTPPPKPVSTMAPPHSPLSSKTTSGSFTVDLFWKPEIIEPGKPITLGVVFHDQRGNLINDALYDILVTDANGKAVLDKKKVVMTESKGAHQVTFDSAGGAHVTVTFEGTLSGVAERINEKAEFDWVVTPEFPLGIAAVMAAMVAMMIVMTRFGKITLPSSSSSN